MLTTDGRLLGGAVRYSQPASGFRSGIEPVLLAASIPARAGETVLEAGTGAGAALLCLGVRVPGVRATGVELAPELAALAAGNIAANGTAGVEIVNADIGSWKAATQFDHAMANPPYHPGEAPMSPDSRRGSAKMGSDSLIKSWIDLLARPLRHRGTLTLIVPAGRVPLCLAAMAASGCACDVLFPLWPKPGRAAKLVLLRGHRNGRRPLRIAAGLVLHRPDGKYTDAAQALLSGVCSLELEAD